ncbi:hypothetical protein F8M41_015590 [Gigaspora margarita]|uniref:Uncharacterized protein n=1 Tax=Gigaspora margarita TaxID=4874 RepID=A0A8H4ENE9_GIGMA|nr:hypothetical protein F8M41_015590 [Gigaspora margarita]
MGLVGRAYNVEYCYNNNIEAKYNSGSVNSYPSDLKSKCNAFECFQKTTEMENPIKNIELVRKASNCCQNGKGVETGGHIVFIYP